MHLGSAVPWVMDIIFIAEAELVSHQSANKAIYSIIHNKKHYNGRHFGCKSK